MKKPEDKSPLHNPFDDEPAERRAAAPASHRKRPRPADDPSPPPAAPPPDPEAALALPRGALVAMRKSGGLRFSSGELVVYRNGRVVQRRRGTGMALHQGAPQQLSDEHLAELLGILERTRFPRFAGPARQSPDTLAYEIVARVGGRIRAAEVSTGRIPEALAPLIGWLNGLLAQDE
jgi:hypothetical protein